jgi:hypothetical protein
VAQVRQKYNEFEKHQPDDCILEQNVKLSANLRSKTLSGVGCE